MSLSCPVCGKRYGGNVQTLDRSIQIATIKHLTGQISDYEMNKVISEQIEKDQKYLRDSIENDINISFHNRCTECIKLNRRIGE